MIAILLLSVTVASSYAATSDRLRSLDRFAEAAMAEYRIPGLALAVVEGEKTVYAKGYGIADPGGRPVTPQTPFYLGSVTKSFTAMAVLQLAEAGRLDLDAPVKSYLPWFRMKDGTAGNCASDRISLRHLLHHTSGIANPTGEIALPVHDDRPDALERQVRSFADVPLIHEPGTSFEYANANYQIAGLVVQGVSGRSIEEAFTERIFRPLGMSHSYTDPTSARADGMATGYRWWFGYPVAFPRQPFPRGCFPSGYGISTAEDLGHYLTAQMNNGRYQEVTVLSPDSVSAMHQPGLNNYGMGWFVGRDGEIEHGGHLECFGAHLYMDMKNRRGIALLVNVNRGEGFGHLGQLAPAMARLLAGDPVSIPPIPTGSRDSLLKLLGVLMGIGIWLGWSVRRLRTWTKGTRPVARGWRLGLFLILPLLLEGMLVTVLILLVPVAIPVAFLHSPDAMWLWLLAICITAGWGLVRTLWAVGLASCRGKGQGARPETVTSCGSGVTQGDS